jgi:alpha-tubulin suppressor-like RCC1 family protein
VFSWGGSSNGATGTSELRHEPELVKELSGKGIKKIVTGYGHMLALLGNNEVISAGNNSNGQVGRQVGQPFAKVTALEGITVHDISACANQSFAMW